MNRRLALLGGVAASLYIAARVSSPVSAQLTPNVPTVSGARGRAPAPQASASSQVNGHVISPSEVDTGTIKVDVLDAGTANIRNNFEVQGTTNLNGQTNLNSTTVVPSGVAFAPGSTAAFWGSTPTITSGFGSSPNVTSSAGTLSFTVNVGTGGSATSGVIGFPNACGHGYDCNCKDVSQAQTATAFTTQTTPFATNACTVVNKTMATGTLVAWGSGDELSCSATCH